MLTPLISWGGVVKYISTPLIQRYPTNVAMEVMGIATLNPSYACLALFPVRNAFWSNPKHQYRAATVATCI